ncbi:hypothetical protein ABE10_01270, partial [Bacillus toyonensis]|nr:hypothetical protein [Bacillus toyonensis]
HGVALGVRRVVGESLRLDEAVRHVHAEAVDAPVEPEAQDGAELRADLLVRPVEVGLGDVEDVQVPLTRRAVGLGDPLPHAAAEDRLPVVGRELAALALPVSEDVPRTLRAPRSRGQGLLEPWVSIRGVVRDEVDDHADPARMRLREHLVEVGQRAEQRIDVAVVGDVVAGVALRAR